MRDLLLQNHYKIKEKQIMKNCKNLNGVIVPILTPFNDKDEIDYPALNKLVDYLLDKGVNALMVGGTTGEGMLMSLNERKDLLESVVDFTGKRTPIIAHTGCIDTKSTIELTKHALQVGANYISAILPYFFTLDDNQIFQHFISISEAAESLPVLIYTFPGNAKNDISADLLKRLIDAKSNIAGIKSSNSDLIRFQDYVTTGGEEFITCFGVDELMLAGLAFGSKAQISGNANVFPTPFIDLYKAFNFGDLEKAQNLQKTVTHIVKNHRAGITPAFFKASLKVLGVPAGNVRPPMRELTKDEFALIEKFVIQMQSSSNV